LLRALNDLALDADAAQEFNFVLRQRRCVQQERQANPSETSG
jgi:hypothetical protein